MRRRHSIRDRNAYTPTHELVMGPPSTRYCDKCGEPLPWGPNVKKHDCSSTFLKRLMKNFKR
jgi:hypothetical protein